MSLVCCLAIPFSGLSKVLRNAIASFITSSQVKLSLSISLLGSFPNPLDCLRNFVTIKTFFGFL